MKGLLAGVIAIVILALVIPRLGDDDPPGPDARPQGPRAAAISPSGSLSQGSSADGMPVFRVSNVGPGTLVEGAVTIANAGRASGYFSLSQADLTDVPGPNGGALSELLRMEVQDVTRPSKPVTVYDGAFAAMDIRPLGFIRPGSSRRYRFTASAPGTEDDSYTASAASARYVWTAFEGAPGPSAPQPRDRRPPILRVTIPGVQRLLTRPYLVATARCGEACRMAVTGRVRAGALNTATAPVRRRARAGRIEDLRVRIPARALRPVRRRLRAGDQVALRLEFSARDRAGNRALVKRTVRLNPRRR